MTVMKSYLLIIILLVGNICVLSGKHEDDDPEDSSYCRARTGELMTSMKTILSELAVLSNVTKTLQRTIETVKSEVSEVWKAIQKTNSTLEQLKGKGGGQQVTCTPKRNSTHPCDGLTCFVNNADECRNIMRIRRCGIAFYTTSTTDTIQRQCKMVFALHSTIPNDSPIHLRENVENILFFKMYSGVRGVTTPSEAFLKGDDSVEVKFPHTNSTTFSTKFYYKSPLWNIRDQIGVTTVSVAMHGNLGNDGANSCELTFAHGNGNNGEWFNKDNLFSSYPFTLWRMKHNAYHNFSITGIDDPVAQREFYAMWHGGCPNDVGPMAVILKHDICSFANGPLPLPRFLCAAGWKSSQPDADKQPNINTYGRFMQELEVTGRLIKPVAILYAGARDES